ncbi:sel1 repeat family protein [Candidatus Protochlamydia phocaeensis]|uniref:sel1 repeat family protein n=1 Tax=Candidatus Protochlamydia phocaeensis TaxID=1414722 RepID=UPI0008387C52|nr:sel1 repeat family protein [Candidatus Protochlamydia phocaeensis]
MPWLLEFMQQTFTALPDHLNASVLAENDDFEVFVLEADEMGSTTNSDEAFKEAYYYFKRAADHDVSLGHYEMALALEYGFGTERSVEDALLHYKQSAETGFCLDIIELAS